MRIKYLMLFEVKREKKNWRESFYFEIVIELILGGSY